MVTAGRDSLLLELEAAAGMAPGDAWILGQRVRYLVEARRLEEARDLAWGCGGAPLWWCGALEGFTLHLQGRFPEAERAFDRALQEMDPEQADRWDDPLPLLDGDARDLFRQAKEAGPTGAGDAMAERLWQQADPLYLVPGNDRRTEQLARHTMVELFSDAATPHRLKWGADMAQLLIRYG